MGFRVSGLGLQADFLEAKCEEIDIENKVVKCRKTHQSIVACP